MHITYKFRVKDKHAAVLNKMARAVNFTWNYCNEVSHRSITYNRKFLSGFDLNRLTTGCSKPLGIPSSTINSICETYVSCRLSQHKIKLNWRSSKRNVGWIPFKACRIKINNNRVTILKKDITFWKSRDVAGKIKTGSFNQDARGRWYVNITCEVTPPSKPKGNISVGIDLGLKSTATLSDGNKFDGSRHYRNIETKLAIAQRARHKKQVRNLHAKIANRRKDELHKFTTQLVNKYDTIFVGDVNSLKLIKTRMAKSVTDAGWGMLRSMLEYKAIRLGVDVIEVKENFSTVTCSGCFERSGPSGLSALGVREWVCIHCGSVHDRDVNAAKNILRFGHESLKGAVKTEVPKTVKR